MGTAPCDATIIMPPMWHVREPWTAPAYIVEALRAKGYSVQFLDYNIRLFRLCEPLNYGHLWTDGAFFDAWTGGGLDYMAEIPDLEEIQGGVVGISVTQTSWTVGAALAKRIRARFPNRKIILGGHSLYFPHEVARISPDAADAICRGEGEQTIAEVMERGFATLEEVPGLYLPDGKGWRLTGDRPMERDLDRLAWPRFEGIDLSLYGKRFLPLMGARGCVGKCVYCQDRYRAPGFRVRSAASQVDELEYLSRAFDVEHFPYNEPLMNGHVGILSEKADEILRRGLRVQFGGNLMVRPDMPAELFQRLRRAGMSIALVGVESGSAKVLRGMRKRHTPEMAETFLRDCHNAGIKAELNFILGFPTETEEDFLETCAFVRRNAAHIDAVISIMPLLVQPSDLYDRHKEFDIVLRRPDDYENWRVRGGGNTLEVRMDRVRRFKELCAELNLLQNEVMGFTAMPKNALPRAATFRRIFSGHYLAPGTDNQGDGGFWEGADRRLGAYAAMQESFSVPGLALKAARSLRNNGLRASVRRGLEWWEIRRS